MSNVKEQDKIDWFSNQYKKVIGEPLPQKHLTTNEVLQRLKESAKYRYINEAKAYKNQIPQEDRIHYLKWSGSQMKKCLCPDRDCICSGNVMLPRKKIPRGERYCKSPFIRKVMQRFRKPVEEPSTKTFMLRLAEAVGAEASVYKDLEENGNLNIKGAEFCTARCIRFYGPGHFPNSTYVSDKQKLQDETSAKQSPDSKMNEEVRLSSDYCCAVSTQATVGSDGDLEVEDFSHILFGTPDEIVMKDIEGTELHISSYKCAEDDSSHAFHLCRFDKLRNLQERYLQSTTQCEEQDLGKDSSEKITIPTLHKEVLREKKEENLRGTMSQIGVLDKNNKTPSKNAHDKSSDQIKTAQETFPFNEYIKGLSTNISAQCKPLCDSFTNPQQQETPPIQNNRTNDTRVIQLSSKEIKCSSKQLIKPSKDIPEDYRLHTINEMKEGLNSQESLQESNHMIASVNVESNQFDLNQVSERRLNPSKKTENKSKESSKVIQNSKNIFVNAKIKGVSENKIRNKSNGIQTITRNITDCPKSSIDYCSERQMSLGKLLNIIKKFSKTLTYGNNNIASNKEFKAKVLNPENQVNLLGKNKEKDNKDIQSKLKVPGNPTNLTINEDKIMCSQGSLLPPNGINKANSSAVSIHPENQNKQSDTQNVDLIENHENRLKDLNSTLDIPNEEMSNLVQNNSVLNKYQGGDNTIENETYRCVKSLPVYTSFRKSKYNRNIRDVSHIFNQEKTIDEEPKCSEKEVYTIEYSDLIEKRSSNSR